MKKLGLLLFFFLLSISNVDAKVKIRGGGAVFTHGIKNMTTSDYRSYTDISHNYCVGVDLNNTDSYLCDSIDEIFLNNLNIEINGLQNDIQNTYINNYDAGSVNYYNGKVNKFNDLIENYNLNLKTKCIQLREYCMPQSCNDRFPGTIYKKSEDKCVCSGGQEYSELLRTKGGNGCIDTTDYNTGKSKNNTDTDSSYDSWFSYLIFFVIIFYVISFFFKK